MCLSISAKSGVGAAAPLVRFGPDFPRTAVRKHVESDRYADHLVHRMTQSDSTLSL